MINKMTEPNKVYHLCGSPTSNYFLELSMIYSRNEYAPWLGPKLYSGEAG